VKLLRKTVILAHRYLGIAASVLAVMWFATGITMMYFGGMPRLTPDLRLASLPPIDVSRVRLTVAEAATRALWDSPPSATLVTAMGRSLLVFMCGSPEVIVGKNASTRPPTISTIASAAPL
jgi:hypothetical protein